MPMLKQHILMLLKYCEPCQMNSYRRLEKCPHELKPILVPKSSFSQIGKYTLFTHRNPFFHVPLNECNLFKNT